MRKTPCGVSASEPCNVGKSARVYTVSLNSSVFVRHFSPVFYIYILSYNDVTIISLHRLLCQFMILVYLFLLLFSNFSFSKICLDYSRRMLTIRMFSSRWFNLFYILRKGIKRRT